MAAIPVRFHWAAALIHPKPSDKILEIGCGTGLLAKLLLEEYGIRHFTGIDRSEAMIKMAIKNNEDAVAEGRAEFLKTVFPFKDPKPKQYNRLVAFNIGFFSKPGSAETEHLKGLIKPDGSLFVFLQAPYEIDIHAAQPIVKNLLNAGFKIKEVTLKKLKPVSALCVISSPAI